MAMAIAIAAPAPVPASPVGGGGSVVRLRQRPSPRATRTPGDELRAGWSSLSCSLLWSLTWSWLSSPARSMSWSSSSSAPSSSARSWSSSAGLWSSSARWSSLAVRRWRGGGRRRRGRWLRAFNGEHLAVGEPRTLLDDIDLPPARRRILHFDTRVALTVHVGNRDRPVDDLRLRVLVGHEELRGRRERRQARDTDAERNRDLRVRSGRAPAHPGSS